jgi:hypothetical protein
VRPVFGEGVSLSFDDDEGVATPITADSVLP